MESISCAVLFPSAPRLSRALHFLWFCSGFYLCCCLNTRPWLSIPVLPQRDTCPMAWCPQSWNSAEGHHRGSRICPMFQLAVGMESARKFPFGFGAAFETLQGIEIHPLPQSQSQ